MAKVKVKWVLHYPILTIFAILFFIGKIYIFINIYKNYFEVLKVSSSVSSALANIIACKRQ